MNFREWRKFPTGYIIQSRGTVSVCFKFNLTVATFKNINFQHLIKRKIFAGCPNGHPYAVGDVSIYFS